MDTVWKTNGVKRVDCCPYCTLAFCSVISISTQGLITPLHYTMSGAPGSRLRHAPFDWLRLGFSAQPHPKGLAGKQEEGAASGARDSPHHARLNKQPPLPLQSQQACIHLGGAWTEYTPADEIYIKKLFSSWCTNCFFVFKAVLFWNSTLLELELQLYVLKKVTSNFFSCLQGQKRLFIECMLLLSMFRRFSFVFFFPANFQVSRL